jgi:ribosomal protein S18 acetylase RimI-like enzyme
MESTSTTQEASHHPDPEGVDLRFVRSWDQFPPGITPDDVIDFLLRALGQFGDDRDHIARGLTDALGETPPGPGFILLALDDERIVGALVMLRTGMTGYVPENLLLYVAVDPEARGRGLGGRICREAIASVEGDTKLHVEYDNPAKRLYERLGFENKYAEMRCSG